MKRYSSFLWILAFAPLFTSCEAIGSIFKAGMYWGFIVVALVIGLIIWLLTGNKNK